mmetsp:Transcript_20800/g.30994  ORF Transcript_20800/g.30994 Transcript_20800/m.30994 type:complete len:229 (+) Transcript_20800:1606-2292(+)
MMKAKNQDSRLSSFASRSYFSIVRLSTLSVRYRMLPDNVDLPASTCPINTKFTCSRGSQSSSSPSSATTSLTSSSTGSGAGTGAGFGGSMFICSVFSITASTASTFSQSASPLSPSITTSSPAINAAISGYCNKVSGLAIIRCALSVSLLAILSTAFHSGSFSSMSVSIGAASTTGAGAGAGTPGVHEAAEALGVQDVAFGLKPLICNLCCIALNWVGGAVRYVRREQ